MHKGRLSEERSSNETDINGTDSFFLKSTVNHNEQDGRHRTYNLTIGLASILQQGEFELGKVEKQATGSHYDCKERGKWGGQKLKLAKQSVDDGWNFNKITTIIIISDETRRSAGNMQCNGATFPLKTLDGRAILKKKLMILSLHATFRRWCPIFLYAFRQNCFSFLKITWIPKGFCSPPAIPHLRWQ